MSSQPVQLLNPPSDTLITCFAAAVGTIWISTAAAKIYFTKRMSDNVEVHGWPQGVDPDAAVGNSGTVAYAAGGTICAALGFWLLK